MVITIDSELDLLGGGAGSISGCADELSGLISRRGCDEETAIRVQGEGRTTQILQFSTLKITAGNGPEFISLTKPLAWCPNLKLIWTPKERMCVAMKYA